MTEPRDLIGASLPDVTLRATDGADIALRALPGITVIYAYPRTSPPDAPPIEGWDLIPGARGCTPQSCAFRDHFSDLTAAGADAVFGLSTQGTAFQQEAAARLHLPFPLLSDERLHLAGTLPTFEAGGMHLFKRVTLILRDGVVIHAMHPIPDPSQNAADVIAWLTAHRKP
ncbi:peroxiredoxin (alkyl hydroperoxide reductase subunit C) [Rubricella aquisinus]|uniref:Peroxiredoxin (Alkyl hydroperoxide reductase subunit C) n=1 Tax=Rubricella aquisinus TaxID=2028108 RepID=A0A840X0R5_9RHOB|nr:peroxiredoxin [Rubricella aquisinus]MBB5515485.1 peroxiredoxin (alkyl hydroperoxide reductase subunit C) [Rubricella aquisinus]